MFDFVCLTLSLADTHGIAKYARTYIRDIHTHIKNNKKVERINKKRGGVRKERKEKKRKDKKKGWEKKEEIERKGAEGKKEKPEKKEGGGWV